MSFEDLLKRQDFSLSKYNELEGYFNGAVSLRSLGVTLPPEVRVLEMASNFPALSVKVLAEALVPEGFKSGASPDVTETLRKIWQANNLDTECNLLITEALAQGLGYWIVGPGRPGIPLVTAARPVGMTIARDHFGSVVEALRRYSVSGSKFAAHYEVGKTSYYQYNGGRYVFMETRETGVDEVPIVPMVNRARLGDVTGRSEMLEILALADAESRSLTSLQVAQELLAMPFRYLFGDGLDQLKDQSGNPLSKIEAYFGRFITGPAGSSAGQIPGADLGQIINTIKMYAQKVSSITGIPPSMLGISTDNPASAEALRVAKDRLISRAEQKQSMFGDAIEDMARISLKFAGVPITGLETLETVWRDPATPSASAKAANILQAQAQGVVSASTARDALPLTPEQKAYETSLDAQRGQLKATLGL